jgi:hypothetical protein
VATANTALALATGLPAASTLPSAKASRRPARVTVALASSQSPSCAAATYGHEPDAAGRAGLLPERNQRAFRLLSVLGPSDFAEWLVPVLLGEPDAAGVLGDLLSRSLVNPVGVDATGEPRYRLHDLLRDYAAERLCGDPVPAGPAGTGRLLAAYLLLAVTASVARTALRFTTPRQPVIHYDNLGAIALLAQIPRDAARNNADVTAIALMADTTAASPAGSNRSESPWAPNSPSAPA